jgi:hypothetical protein
MYVYGRIYLQCRTEAFVKVKSSFLRRILEHGDVEGALRQRQVYICACAIFFSFIILKETISRESCLTVNTSGSKLVEFGSKIYFAESGSRPIPSRLQRFSQLGYANPLMVA